MDRDCSSFRDDQRVTNTEGSWKKFNLPSHYPFWQQHFQLPPLSLFAHTWRYVYRFLSRRSLGAQMDLKWGKGVEKVAGR